MNTKGLDYTILTIAIIGAINWGLVGFFKLDLVALIFGEMSLVSRIIYAVVGLCGLYLISLYGRVSNAIENLLRLKLCVSIRPSYGLRRRLCRRSKRPR